MKLIKKLLKFLIVLIVIIPVMLIAALYFSDYNSFLEKKVVGAARAANINLALKDSRFGPRGFGAKEIELFFPRIFMPLSFSDFDSRVSWLALLSSVFSGTINTNLYDGSLRSSFNFRYLENTGDLNAALKNVIIDRHPAAASLGLSGGELNATVTDLKGSPEGLTGGSLDLKLTGLNKKLPSDFNIRTRQGSFPVKIPAFSDLNLHAAARAADRAVRIDEFTADSSLFNIIMDGNLGVSSSGRIESLNLNGKVDLSDQGASELGGYLLLISRGMLRSEDRQFSFYVSGSPDAPDVRFARR